MQPHVEVPPGKDNGKKTLLIHLFKPGFHYMAKTTTQNKSDHKVEQSSVGLIALFRLKIGRSRGRKWLKAWFPLTQLLPRQRPIPNQERKLSLRLIQNLMSQDHGYGTT